MQTEVQPLEAILHELVRETFESKMGVKDPEITGYIARVLCEFSEPDSLFRLHDKTGKRIEKLHEMVLAADPVYGMAASFDEERATRKYIGDYALFVAGMCHEVLKSTQNTDTNGPTITELVEAGKESYYIVSQFDQFEYAQEAPLFARLAEDLERCILGLALTHQEMSERVRIRLGESL